MIHVTVTPAFNSCFVLNNNFGIALIMVQCVMGSIAHGGPTEIFLIPATAPQLD